MSCANTGAAGLPEAAAIEPSTHEDAHIRLAFSSSGGTRVVDCERPQQEWSLLHISRAQDGCVRRVHQCAIGPRPHQHPSAPVCWQDELEGEDHANPCFQLDREC